MDQTLSPRWNLEVIFPGGSRSLTLAQWLADLVTEIEQLQAAVAAARPPSVAAELPAFSDLLARAQALFVRLREAVAFVTCLNAQDTSDEGAKALEGRMNQINAAYGGLMVKLDHLLLGLSEELFESLVARTEWTEVAWVLRERRQLAREQMRPELEGLATSLSADGYHAWGDLYYRIVGRMGVTITGQGEPKRYSMGQMWNLLLSADPGLREEAAERYEAAWAQEADLIGTLLNNLAGYRLALYRQRGWSDVLHEPLLRNRLRRESLEAMWATIAANRAPYVQFLQRKAKLMGKQRLGWHDVLAPVYTVDRLIPYPDAARFIVEQFGRFSPAMAQFAEKAFKAGWIEAEDRPGKRPGGFHITFPASQQSRVYMTYMGHPGNVATLAHELGHAYHTAVLWDLPQWARSFAPNVAETASTFAELLVADAAIKMAPSEAERITLVGDKAERSLQFCMNIYARYLFEVRFYTERQRGPVGVERLNELMIEAQQEAFGGALGSYHPHFWAATLHFYLTQQPFYNFPYSFGYLFATGVYARALQEGPAFERRYVALLRDTGRISTEELALRHLGADLTQPAFWQEALALCIKDVDAFLTATEAESATR